VPVDDWLFAPTPARATFLTADALSHKFRRLGAAAGVERPALHRLRHGVATHLVGNGELLGAQARLGHRDPTTTLRHYSHAVARHDEDIANDLDELLNGRDLDGMHTEYGSNDSGPRRPRSRRHATNELRL
jgi:integrase